DKRFVLPLRGTLQIFDADFALVVGNTFYPVLRLVIRTTVIAAAALVHGWLAIGEMGGHALQIVTLVRAREDAPAAEQQQCGARYSQAHAISKEFESLVHGSGVIWNLPSTIAILLAVHTVQTNGATADFFG